MAEHALLAPSSASRWTICTPAPRLEAGFRDKGSVFADEGTLAHDVGEKLLKAGTPYLELPVWRKFKEHELYTEALYNHACDYAAYVRSFITPGKDYRLFVEKKLILQRWIPGGFGHGDSALLTGTTLHVFDFKFGSGVLVPYLGNKQLRIYSLGWLEDLDLLYDIRTIHMHIYQPRMDNIGYDTISRNELMLWGNSYLKPIAKLAFSGEGEFVPGDHCHFCKANARCKALADHNLELAAMQFQDPFFMTDEEMGKVLERKGTFEKWIKAVHDYMLDEAYNRNKNWPGLKLVEGRSNRKYIDEQAVADSIKHNLHQTDVYKPKELIGITELEAKIGAIYFKRFVSPLLIKPPGAPTLVPLSDARPVFNSAAEDFAEPLLEDWME